jgi:hypothetical protein
MREQPCLADTAPAEHHQQSAGDGRRLQFFQFGDAVGEIQFHNAIFAMNMMIVKHYVCKA